MAVKSFSSILIIKPGAIGDVLHMTPVIRALKEKHPASRVSFLVSSPLTASLFRGNPLVDEVIVFDKKGAHKSFGGLLSLWRMLKSRRFDLVLNYQRSNIKGWLLASAGFPCTVVVYHKTRGTVVHAIADHLNPLRKVGIDPDRASHALNFFPSKEENAFADRFLVQTGLAGKRLVAFNPGTSHASKCWPIERFAELGDLLADEREAVVVVLGSRDEKPLADEIRRRMRHAVYDLTGCSLGELGAVLQRVEFLLTGDTGPMHIAAAVGTRVVALYGPISPVRSGPVGEGHRILIHDELECCPCNIFECKHSVFRECMERITVREALQACLDMLDERPPTIAR